MASENQPGSNLTDEQKEAFVQALKDTAAGERVSLDTAKTLAEVGVRQTNSDGTPTMTPIVVEKK